MRTLTLPIGVLFLIIGSWNMSLRLAVTNARAEEPDRRSLRQSEAASGAQHALGPKSSANVLTGLPLPTVYKPGPLAADELRRSGAKRHTQPFHMPMYEPPPTRYRVVESVNVVFKTSAEALREVVPQPLKPNKDNVAMLVAANLHKTEPFELKYGLVGVYVPVTFHKNGKTIEGIYPIHYYEDNPLPVIKGRETYGWPKEPCRVAGFRTKGNIVHARAHGHQRGGPIADYRVKLSAEVTKLPATKIPFFAFKRIPSVEKDAPPDVEQLTMTLFQFGKRRITKGTVLGRGLGVQDPSPFSVLPVLEIVEAYHQHIDGFTLAYGKVLHDYLKD